MLFTKSGNGDVIIVIEQMFGGLMPARTSNWFGICSFFTAGYYSQHR